MFNFTEYTDRIIALDSSRRNSQAPAAHQDDIMGSKQSKISPPGSPKLNVFTQSRIQGGRVTKRTAASRQVGRETIRTKKMSGSTNSSSSIEDELMMDNSSESDDGVGINKDLEMVDDDDFGSHHSSLPDNPSEREDTNSDAESHPSGIGSDLSVHTDPEEEPYEYGPDEDEMPGVAKVDFFLEVQGKLRMEERDRTDWHDAEIRLFDELDLRGTQPLLPIEWAGDFPTCPPLLFSEDYDQTFLNSTSGDEFAGARALRELVALGSRVRSVIAGSRTREKVIEWGIKQYITWAEKDGGYARKSYNPIVTVTAGKPGQNISEITQITQSEMYHLATLQRRAHLLEEGDGIHPVQFLMDPPLIYGIMVAGSIVIFVTLNSAFPDDTPKTIAHFNYDDPTMDVWNAFAIAILVTATRDWMTGRLDDFDDLPEKEDIDA